MSKVYGRRDRTARLLKLQVLLWQNPNGLMIEEIAQKCSTSRKTVYRDLKALETELEVPVWEKGSRRGIVDGYFLPPIHFTQREAINIYLALRLVEKYSLIYNPSVASTFLKLNSVVSPPLRKYIQDALEHLGNKPQNENSINNLNKLAEAWLSRRQVKIWYKGVFDKEPTERTIEPYLIEPAVSGHSSFVVAYCHRKQTIVNYKIDRIVGEVTVCEEKYEIPADFEPNELLDSAWSIYTNEGLINVKLRFKPQIKDLITPTIWHLSQKLDVQEDGSVIMSLTVHDAVDFRAWILGWAGMVEVLEPKVLREEIVNIAYSVLCTYCTNKGTNTLSCNGIWRKPENIPHVDLTDEEWRLVREVLPPPEHAGRPRTDDRKTINGILWKLKSGAGWNTIPRKYGSSSTCHARFRSWQQSRVWENALQTLFSNSALKRI